MYGHTYVLHMSTVLRALEHEPCESQCTQVLLYPDVCMAIHTFCYRLAESRSPEPDPYGSALRQVLS